MKIFLGGGALVDSARKKLKLNGTVLPVVGEDGTTIDLNLVGDIPLVGRLFRTNVDQHIKRNLVIFVTARVITPAGLAFNNEKEEEEGLLPPALPEVPAYKK